MNILEIHGLLGKKIISEPVGSTINGVSPRMVKLTESALNGDVVFETENVLSTGIYELKNGGLNSSAIDSYNSSNNTAFQKTPIHISSDGSIIILTERSPNKIARFIWNETLGKYTRQTNETDVATPNFPFQIASSEFGSNVVLAHTTSPYLSSYKYDDATNSFVKTNNPDVMLTSSAYNIAMSQDGNMMALTFDYSPYFYSYKWNSTSNRYERTAQPDLTFTGAAWYQMSMSADGLRIAARISTSGILHIMDWNEANNRYEKLTTGTTSAGWSDPSGTYTQYKGRPITLSKNKQFMAVAYSTGIRWYKWDVAGYYNRINEPLYTTTFTESSSVESVKLSDDGLEAMIFINQMPYIIPVQYNEVNNRFEEAPALNPQPAYPYYNDTGYDFTFRMNIVSYNVSISPYFFVIYKRGVLTTERLATKFLSPSVLPLNSCSIGYLTESGNLDDVVEMDALWWSKDPWTEYTIESPITISSIPIPLPTGGATPVTTLETSEYYAEITWSPNVTTFDYGANYTATITLVPKSGYTLSGISENYFIIPGATLTNDANSGVIQASFPTTALRDITQSVINLPQPVAGQTPVTSLNQTEYTVSVVWTPSHSTFQALTTYSANISVTPKSGYTLSNIPQNFFIVNGSLSSTNASGSGNVNVQYSETPLLVINDSTIPLTAPVTNSTAQTTIDDTQFTGTVVWTPSHSTFQTETTYSAVITLTPKTNYTFTGISNNFFTISGASSISSVNNVVNVTFPLTKTLITNVVLPDITPMYPILGETMTLQTNLSTPEVTYEIEWVDSLYGNQTFQDSHTTFLEVRAYAKPGYQLTYDTTFTVNGYTLTHEYNLQIWRKRFPPIINGNFHNTSAPFPQPKIGSTIPRTFEQLAGTGQTFEANLTPNPNHLTYQDGNTYNLNITIIPTVMTNDYFGDLTTVVGTPANYLYSDTLNITSGPDCSNVNSFINTFEDAHQNDIYTPVVAQINGQSALVYWSNNYIKYIQNGTEQQYAYHNDGFGQMVQDPITKKLYAIGNRVYIIDGGVVTQGALINSFYNSTRKARSHYYSQNLIIFSNGNNAASYNPLTDTPNAIGGAVLSMNTQIIGDDLYIFGYGNIYRYSLPSMTLIWQTTTTGRVSDVCKLGSYIYIVGESLTRVDTAYGNNFYRYDPANGTIITMPNLDATAFGSVSDGSQIYVLGTMSKVGTTDVHGGFTFNGTTYTDLNIPSTYVTNAWCPFIHNNRLYWMDNYKLKFRYI